MDRENPRGFRSSRGRSGEATRGVNYGTLAPTIRSALGKRQFCRRWQQCLQRERDYFAGACRFSLTRFSFFSKLHGNVGNLSDQRGMHLLAEEQLSAGADAFLETIRTLKEPKALAVLA